MITTIKILIDIVTASMVLFSLLYTIIKIVKVFSSIIIYACVWRDDE